MAITTKVRAVSWGMPMSQMMSKMARRRAVLPVVASLLLVVIAAVFLLPQSLRICAPIDRMLNLSSCKSSVVINGFEPLSDQTMTVPDADGVASLLGRERNRDGVQAVMLRLDPDSGDVTNRFPLEGGTIWCGWFPLPMEHARYCIVTRAGAALTGTGG